MTAYLGSSNVTSLDVIFHHVGGEVTSHSFTRLGDHVIYGLSPYTEYVMTVRLFTDLCPGGLNSSKQSFRTKGGKRT